MQPFSIGDDNEKLTSLAVVLPLAVVGFVVSAGCWTIFAAAGEHLRAVLGLGSPEFGLLLAMPMASGALLAVPAGMAAQKVGARRVMVACLLGLAVCMALLVMVESWAGYLLVAAGLGVAGGFYSAGLQFVTCYAPARYLGLALGVFGAGVTGAGFNYYLVPLILQAFSWNGVPLAYLVVLLLVAALLMLLTDDPDSRVDPDHDTRVRWLSGVLESSRAWRLCLYFGVVAGSFFSLALWLPEFMTSRFLLTMESGARLALWFVVPGALAQVAGGAMADRYGAEAVVLRSMVAGLFALFFLSYPPMTLSVYGIDSVITLELALPIFLEGFFIVVLGAALGSAMGALQYMAVVRNLDIAALAAGMLLFSACMTAFLLPVLFGVVVQWTGVGSAMFVILFLLLTASLFMFARDTRREQRQALLHGGVSGPYPMGGRGGL